ncbi:hypothetical protein [Rummeliibacillus pycnus]|uniref:hypothetical protein n=1 Tax=Rummeliibacillus pycnus TaxID=101070 RepID=UPI0037C65E70
MPQRPSLYDRSIVLTDESFICRESTKKILILREKDTQISKELFPKTIPVIEMVIPENKEMIRQLIQSQTIGTHIFVLAPWDKASMVFDVCIEEGMAEEELQIQILGEKKKKVYCMKCYQLHEVKLDDTTTQCSCGTHLSVGPFFSALRKGYIGYPFLPIIEKVRSCVR